MAFPFYSSITDSVMVVMNVSGLNYLDLCMRSSGVFIDVIHGDVDVASTLLCAPCAPCAAILFHRRFIKLRRSMICVYFFF